MLQCASDGDEDDAGIGAWLEVRSCLTGRDGRLQVIGKRYGEPSTGPARRKGRFYRAHRVLVFASGGGGAICSTSVLTAAHTIGFGRSRHTYTYGAISDILVEFKSSARLWSTEVLGAYRRSCPLLAPAILIFKTMRRRAHVLAS